MGGLVNGPGTPPWRGWQVGTPLQQSLVMYVTSRHQGRTLRPFPAPRAAPRLPTPAVQLTKEAAAADATGRTAGCTAAVVPHPPSPRVQQVLVLGLPVVRQQVQHGRAHGRAAAGQRAAQRGHRSREAVRVSCCVACVCRGAKQAQRGRGGARWWQVCGWVADRLCVCVCVARQRQRTEPGAGRGEVSRLVGGQGVRAVRGTGGGAVRGAETHFALTRVQTCACRVHAAHLSRTGNHLRAAATVVPAKHIRAHPIPRPFRPPLGLACPTCRRCRRARPRPRAPPAAAAAGWPAAPGAGRCSPGRGGRTRRPAGRRTPAHGTRQGQCLRVSGLQGFQGFQLGGLGLGVWDQKASLPQDACSRHTTSKDTMQGLGRSVRA